MIILYIYFFFTLIFLLLMLLSFSFKKAPDQLRFLFILGFSFCSIALGLLYEKNSDVVKHAELRQVQENLKKAEKGLNDFLKEHPEFSLE